MENTKDCVVDSNAIDAKKGYTAYCNAVGNVTHNGSPMKEFHELPINIQQAWIAATDGKNGEEAYEFYCKANNFRTYDGRPTLAYVELGKSIMNAWECFASRN